MFSQDSPSNKNKLKKVAYEYFNNEEFSKALPMLLKLDSIEPNNFETKYYIGACYLNTPYNKAKGIPYLEYAIENGRNLLPEDVFFDLGTLYHFNYQFDEAINVFNNYLNVAQKNATHYSSAQRMINVCNNAKNIVAEPVQYEITNIGLPINTDNSEKTPFISADEELMYFTRAYSKDFEQVNIEFLKKIFISKLKNKKWQEPTELVFNDFNNEQLSISGVSTDGEYLYVSVGNESSSDIYECKIFEGKVIGIKKLPEIINSPYWEGNLSFSSDGQEMFFSSNRPGGYGGKDIFKVVKDNNGNWSNLTNLGSTINTEFDEDAPFIHPSNKLLYFSSAGHNTIGGYDIFCSTFTDSVNLWSNPVNIGYPVNTTSDDIGFVIAADGNTAYLSSAQDNLYGKQHIYKVTLHKTIPLTLIKGTILGGEPSKPISAKIKVINHETKERLKYIYNPNPKTGKYLMIFPPNKNYDILVEADGYYPQLVNVFVPNQTYFYELFQEIILKQIKIIENDSIIGQEIKVTNTFYDIYKTQKSNDLLDNDTNQIHKFDNLLQTVENIINTTDSIGLNRLDELSSKLNNFKTNSKEYKNLLNLIESAIEKTDSLSLKMLDANTVYNDITNKVYYFGVNNNSLALQPVIIDNDTIYTLPTIKTNQNLTNKTSLTNDSTVNENVIDFKKSKESNRHYIYLATIYYEVGVSELNKKYFNLIEGICKQLILNKNIGVEINGYADPTGSEESNLELSKNRTFNVMEYMVKLQIDQRRIIMNSHGEVTSDENTDYSKFRKTEIKVFEINNK